ncbi:hypothetical protein KKC1_03640 [Calderihabitans maritimus]|uniref:Uncharacterized protein n=1 Tax=Calderihabitans maritimus TaxID=1246530 RepID=A0A1Z5HNU1_9FIRM|nr:hypothetical protein KKC1_03640 [Calderihabitans maritimus]
MAPPSSSNYQVCTQIIKNKKINKHNKGLMASFVEVYKTSKNGLFYKKLIA